jgi:hypothetical protein
LLGGLSGKNAAPSNQWLLLFENFWVIKMTIISHANIDFHTDGRTLGTVKAIKTWTQQPIKANCLFNNKTFHHLSTLQAHDSHNFFPSLMVRLAHRDPATGRRCLTHLSCFYILLLDQPIQPFKHMHGAFGFTQTATYRA